MEPSLTPETVAGATTKRVSLVQVLAGLLALSVACAHFVWYSAQVQRKAEVEEAQKIESARVNAIDGLARLASALKVRISYNDYVQLLQEAQFTLDKYEMVDKDSLTASTLREAMQDYTLAADLWQYKIDNSPRDLISIRQPAGKALLDRYDLRTFVVREAWTGSNALSIDDGMRVCWATASKRIEHARNGFEEFFSKHNSKE